MQLNCNSKNGSDVVNFLSTQWSTGGSTSPEPMGLCITLMGHSGSWLGHSSSRTTTSSLWKSTLSGMSMCLASSGQHLVDGEGSSGSSSGSSRMVLPHTPQTNHWHGYDSVSLTDWSTAGVTRSGRRIHRVWTPQVFICGDTLRTGCLATTPRPSLTWRQQSQQP